MTVTSIDIDDALLAEVTRITGARSKKEAVTFSLQRTVQMQHQLELLQAAAHPEVLEILSHMHEEADALRTT